MSLAQPSLRSVGRVYECRQHRRGGKHLPGCKGCWDSPAVHHTQTVPVVSTHTHSSLYCERHYGNIRVEPVVAAETKHWHSQNQLYFQPAGGSTVLSCSQLPHPDTSVLLSPPGSITLTCFSLMEKEGGGLNLWTRPPVCPCRFVLVFKSNVS